MTIVRLAAAVSAHPPGRVAQVDAARQIAELTGDHRRLSALARASGIDQRAAVLPPEGLAQLRSIEERNGLYQQFAPGLALEVAREVVPPSVAVDIGCLFTSSCTGYTIPGWGGPLLGALGLARDTARVPLTEPGCAGGVVGLAHAADYVRAHPQRSALVVAVELCTLSFQAGTENGVVMSNLLFGDGAGAALLAPGRGPGLELLDSSSLLIPNSRELLGFDLTNAGFVPVLKSELVDCLVDETADAVAALLERNHYQPADIGAWLLHPGGPRILRGIERRMGLASEQTAWSWASMREFGNTSSAAIFDVVRRYLAEPVRDTRPVVIAAFGPGVSIELILARPSC